MRADTSVVSAFHKLLVRQLLRDFPIRSPATLPTKDFGEQLSRNSSCSISRGSFEREQCQDHHVYWRPAKLPFSSTRSFLIAPVLNFVFLCKVKNKAEETWFFENWIAKVMTKFKKPERIMINQMMVHFWGEYGLVCSCSMSLCKAKDCGWAVYRWKAWTFHLDIVLTVIWNLPHDWMLFNHFVYPSPS